MNRDNNILKKAPIFFDEGQKSIRSALGTTDPTPAWSVS